MQVAAAGLLFVLALNAVCAARAQAVAFEGALEVAFEVVDGAVPKPLTDQPGSPPRSETGAAHGGPDLKPNAEPSGALRAELNASPNAAPGDVARGRAIVVDRRVGLCLLCHSGPFPEERFQGTLAPALNGAGARWNAAQLRLRVADSARINPATLMPAYYRVDGLTRVGAAWRGKTVLDAQQVEDVVAFLVTLK